MNESDTDNGKSDLDPVQEFDLDDNIFYDSQWQPNIFDMYNIPFTGENKLLVPLPGENESLDWLSLLVHKIFLEIHHMMPPCIMQCFHFNEKNTTVGRFEKICILLTISILRCLKYIYNPSSLELFMGIVLWRDYLWYIKGKCHTFDIKMYSL